MKRSDFQIFGLKHAVCAAMALAFALPAAPAAAMGLTGDKTISATTADGSTIVLGTVHFTPGADGRISFKIIWQKGPFASYFLSMRDFKCIAGKSELTCQVPYPYRNPQTIRQGDYAWLEHSLLFFYKPLTEFGANLQNGVYYELKDEGDALVGTPKGVDLNLIASPPDHQDKPPFTPDTRDNLPAADRWLQRIIIK